ncbi:hypothetical protein LTR37_015757 [Vermiconidia calcicola]|uniref:Uncharacterized protein n=1 Tax=Vermiconidia calcicola TaxID=1690605 RepID=A0ACC3MPU0_9PEZI|nr:hypothetical protein LTR37_015757 [Vermiconidia calcicola]
MPGVYPPEDEPQHESPHTNDEGSTTSKNDQHDETVLSDIQTQLRSKFPRYTDEQINGIAVEILKGQSGSTYQARRSALSTAAAGIIEEQALTPQQQSNVDQMLQAHAGIDPAGAAGVQPRQQQDTTFTSTSTTTSTPTCPPQHYAHIMRQLQEQQMREEQSPTNGQAESHEDGF